jgi:murein DD-endopeptidase MepM/ murein hydrolase activator NlpD
LSWPLAVRAFKFVTSPFGERVHPIEGVLRKHAGVDLAASLGQPVQSAAPGRVLSAGWMRGHGYQVEVQHTGGFRTRYSHLSALLVEPGAMVEAGSTLGLAGATGMATGVHLHFEVWKKGQAKNPMAWFHLPRAKSKAKTHQYVARPHHAAHATKGSS